MLLTPGLALVLSIPVSVTGRFPPIRGLSRPQGCGLALKNGLTHAALSILHDNRRCCIFVAALIGLFGGVGGAESPLKSCP